MQNKVANHSTECYTEKIMVLMTRKFRKWAKKEKINVDLLKQAVMEAENGLIDARLGNCLIKKRIGTLNKGKRSGLRTILFFKKGDKSIFVHGFAKNEKDNITDEEKHFFKSLVDIFLSMSEEEFYFAIKCEKLFEVKL